MDKIVRKFHSFDEADNADYEYYRALFGNERLQILLELIMPENPDAIVGAWALAFHGRPRYTGDIDIFVARDEENAAKVMELIEAFGFGQSGIKRGDFIQADHVIQLSVARPIASISSPESAASFSTRHGRAGSRELFPMSPCLLLAATF